MKFAVFLIVTLTAPLVWAAARDLPLEDGDIIFQKSMSRQSQAIEAATHSPLTHVGIVFFEKGEPWIYEAVQPVRKIRLKDWGKRGKNGSYIVRRLKDKTAIDMDRLKCEVTSFMGKDYDLQFGWCDSRIYCSELVWKAYARASGVEIGHPGKLGDLDLSHPVVKRTLYERYGSRIPFDMAVISPADIFQSDLLYTVLEK